MRKIGWIITSMLKVDCYRNIGLMVGRRPTISGKAELAIVFLLHMVSSQVII